MEKSIKNNNMKAITETLFYLALAGLSFSVTGAMVAGIIQEYIKFADPLNEIAFAFIFSMLGGCFAVAAFSKDTKKA